MLFSMIVAALWASHYSMMASVWAQRQLFFSVRQWLLSDAMRKYKQKEKPSVRQCDEVSVRQYMVPKPSTVAEAARQERVKKEERLAIPPPVPPDNIGTSRRIYRRRLRHVIAAPPSVTLWRTYRAGRVHGRKNFSCLRFAIGAKALAAAMDRHAASSSAEFLVRSRPGRKAFLP